MTDPFDQDPELTSTIARLERERPVPAPAFRGELGRRLRAREERPRGARIRRLVLAYACSGTALLAVAAIGVAGAGPLAA